MPIPQVIHDAPPAQRPLKLDEAAFLGERAEPVPSSSHPSPAPDALRLADEAAAAVATSPHTRARLEDIQAEIHAEFSVTGDAAVFEAHQIPPLPNGGIHPADALSLVTLHFIVLKSGWVEVGKSACADPANYDAELGRRFAREDAMRRLWPLFGFAIKQRVAAGQV